MCPLLTRRTRRPANLRQLNGLCGGFHLKDGRYVAAAEPESRADDKRRRVGENRLPLRTGDHERSVLPL